MKIRLLSFFLLIIVCYHFGCDQIGTASGNKNNQPAIDTASLVNTMGSPLIEELSKKIAKAPNDHLLLAKRADIYYSKDNYEDAIKDLEKAIGIDSSQIGYYHLLADAQLDSYQSEQAIKTMETAVALNPDRIPTLLKLSEFQMILKQHEASFETINEILTKSPKHPEGFYMLGMNFKAIGDTAKAINSFQTTVEEDSEHIEAYIQLGVLFDKLKNRVAVKYFDNALRIDSTDIDALFGKAWFHHQRNNFFEAEQWYEKASKAHPRNSKVHLNNGILQLEIAQMNANKLATKKLLKKAFKKFDLASKVDPSFGMAYYYRGLTHEKLKRPKKAITDYRQAAALMQNANKPNRALMALGQKPITK